MCQGHVLNRQNLFENTVLRRIFLSETNYIRIIGVWRTLRNEELHSLYASPHIIIMIKWRSMRRTGHVERMGEKRNAYRVLVRKSVEGRRVWRDITPCSPVKVNRRFGGTYRLLFQGQRISRARKQRECKRQALCLWLTCLFFDFLLFKRHFFPLDLHEIII
jgi:hypothetical protein